MTRVVRCAATVLLASTGRGLAQDDTTPPPLAAPGRLVDVGGWRLHIYCTGAYTGATVILEAGVGDFSVEWSLVQSAAAQLGRVCTYDRAGDGWSELGPHPRTLRQLAFELHTLLTNAGERGPYVVVGHSYGAWIVRTYTSAYPDDVAALILIDGGADNPWRLLPDGSLVRSADLARGRPIPPVRTANPLRLADIPPGALAQMRAGLSEASRTANAPPRDKLPLHAQQMRTWALGRLSHVAAAVNPVLEEELAVLRAEREQTARPYGDRPVVVIIRGLADEETPAMRAREAERRDEYIALTGLSSHGRHLVASRSGHHIQLDEPELVVAAIRDVLASLAR